MKIRKSPDIDGVVLDWESSFTAWMSQEGYEVVNDNVYKQSKRYGIEQELADTLVSRHLMNVLGLVI